MPRTDLYKTAENGHNDGRGLDFGPHILACEAWHPTIGGSEGFADAVSCVSSDPAGVSFAEHMHSIRTQVRVSQIASGQQKPREPNCEGARQVATNRTLLKDHAIELAGKPGTARTRDFVERALRGAERGRVINFRKNMSPPAAREIF